MTPEELDYTYDHEAHFNGWDEDEDIIDLTSETSDDGIDDDLASDGTSVGLGAPFDDLAL